ncbi:TPA: hypothetical protein DIC20_05115 [Candidatus Dependentiae bacterium]|nr:hypothetical protein [Candidatus Dependentiae bacterium]HCU01051.1 hypothetical protein [Candidatus Dependentiae bacterium]
MNKQIFYFLPLILIFHNNPMIKKEEDRCDRCLSLSSNILGTISLLAFCCAFISTAHNCIMAPAKSSEGTIFTQINMTSQNGHTVGFLPTQEAIACCGFALGLLTCKEALKTTKQIKKCFKK